MTSRNASFVLATVLTAITASACCGPFPAVDVAADRNLTVDVVVEIDGAREPVCDATVTAFVIDDDGNIDEDAPIELSPATLDDACVYRAIADNENHEIRVTHPELGSSTEINVTTDTSDGTCVVVTGLDGVDRTVVLPGTST